MKSARAFAVACLALLAVAGCATPPEEDPVQIKLNDLDTRLARIEKVVANNSLLELSNQMGELRADLRAMHNDIDELNHALDTSRKQQRDLYADLDQRLKALEARSGVVATARRPRPGLRAGADGRRCCWSGRSSRRGGGGGRGQRPDDGGRLRYGGLPSGVRSAEETASTTRRSRLSSNFSRPIRTARSRTTRSTGSARPTT